MRHSSLARSFILAGLILSTALVHAQTPSTADILKALPARNLGPTSMGGRVSSIAVYEKEPRIFYVGSAGGGLWRTVNGGITFDCIFQYESTVALGAVHVNPDDPNDIWVGTGDHNSRNSVMYGDGVYHTTDGGKTWAHMGLEKTMFISSIWVHPKNKNVVFVGALGHLWGPNKERGLYKSTDGGKSWKQVHFVNDLTGVIDLDVDPNNPNTMYVAQWERLRWPYKWASGGKGSGLFKSTDGGETWKKITKGLPTADTGRIGVDIYRKNPKVLVATVEAGAPNERGVMSPAGGFYKSTDGGESWERLSGTNPRPFYFSIPRIDPNDENRVYVPGVQIQYSEDGGKTFRNFPSSVHVDHHAFWINPSDSNHIIIGEDGGAAQTRDKGDKWEHLNYLPLGQYYAIGVDMRKPYWVYGGLQDNGTWGLPTQSIKGAVTNFDARFINGGDGFHAQVDPEDWRIVYAESQGGAIARHNIETGEQRFIRPNPPQPAEGQPREVYRFNWSAPIVLSPHNAGTIWFGGNKLFKSVNRGDTWEVVSPDLSTNDPAKQDARAGVSPEDTGAERHCTIITISESPRKAGMVWVGTDDGNVQLTQDGGTTWTNLTPNFPGVPKNTWVSRVVASRYDTARAYVTFDGHRNNDFKKYIFVTSDYGKTWEPITNGIGDESVYCLIEGTTNRNLLICGTEMGLYFSLDRGANWTKFHKANGFPTVRVDDLVIHPRELELVVATHGRALWTIPVSALEQLDEATLAKDVAVLKPSTMYGLGKVFDGWYEGDRLWTSPNTQPGAQIFYYMKSPTTEKVTVSVQDVLGNDIGTLDGTGNAGLNYVNWAPRGRRSTGLTTGQYRVVVKVGDKEFTNSLNYENLAGTLDH